MASSHNVNPFQAPYSQLHMTSYPDNLTKEILEDHYCASYPSTYDSPQLTGRQDTTSVIQDSLQENIPESPIPRGFENYFEESQVTQQSTNTPPKRKSNICVSKENIMKTWTSEDDQNLKKLADQYKNDWKKIAKRIITQTKKKVTPNFLKNRYKDIAGEQIKKGVKFSHEEDLLIAKLFEKHNTQWTLIAAEFTDRTPVMIKNRYYSHIRRKGLLQNLTCEAKDSNSQTDGKMATDADEIESFIGSGDDNDEDEKLDNTIGSFDDAEKFITNYHEEPMGGPRLFIEEVDYFQTGYCRGDGLHERITEYNYNY